MYYVYDRAEGDGVTKLQRKKRICLVGCKSGIIPDLLRCKLKPDHNEPYDWELDISEDYSSRGEAVIVDMKPYDEDCIFLCELDKAYGYSHNGWTPILLRLKGLYVDEPVGSLNKESFDYPNKTDLIYTMSYLSGTVENGNIKGRWTGSGPSRSVLLFPKTLTFFLASMGKNDPGLFRETEP